MMKTHSDHLRLEAIIAALVARELAIEHPTQSFGQGAVKGRALPHAPQASFGKFTTVPPTANGAGAGAVSAIHQLDADKR